MGKSWFGRSSSRRHNDEQINGEDKFEKKQKDKHPVDLANMWSFATFSWMSDLMFSAYKNSGLQTSHIPHISDKEGCRKNTDALEQLWTREVAFADSGSGNPPSFGHVIWLHVRTRVLFTSIVFLTSIVLGFIGPTFLMKRILQFASASDTGWKDGILWVSLLILCEFARVLFFTLTWALSYRTAIRLKAACMGLVYRKIFRLGNLNDSTASKLLNVISSDCTLIYDVIITVQVAIGGPVVLLLCVGYIVSELGWLSLVGLAVFPLSYPLQYLLAKGSGSLRRKAIDVKDDRVTFMTQAIHYLKFLKMFAWEKHFQSIISGIRLNEKDYLQRCQLLQSFSIVIGPTLPHVGAIITFILYINSGHNLTPAQAFCIVALFIGRVRPTLTRVRSGFRAYFEARISISRIQCFTILFLFSLFGYTIRSISQLSTYFYTTKIFNERMESVLTLPEIWDGDREVHGSNHASLNEAIVVEEVTIIRRSPIETDHGDKEKSKKFKSANKTEKACNSIEKLLGTGETEPISFQLENLHFSIKKGRFIGICGHVGSGKTTFLEAIAGSISAEKGSLNVYGKIAYVPQEPWIFKGTLRENVIFGETFESVRYYNSIDACCLVNDFAIFMAGDLTETSESGSNLSGGQKQRISLSRALYHAPSRDIYLLDDPFSGLDSRVAKTVFERVVQNQLRSQNKTILMVTHQMQFLRECDEILVFAEGSIAERGTHDQLMAVSQSHYANLIANGVQSKDDNYENIMLEDSVILDCKPGEVFKDEEKVKRESKGVRGSVPWSVYNLYIESAGGKLSVIMVFLAFALSIGSTAFSSWWLKNWFGAPGIPPIYRSTNINETNSIEFSGNTIDDSDENITNTKTSAEFINRESPNFEFYQNIYAAIIGVIFLTSLLRTLLFVFTSIKASQSLHHEMLTQFFRNRLKSSERIGAGHILNLFTRDMEEIDINLPNTLEFFLQNAFIVLSVFTLVSIVFPAFLGPLLAFFFILLFIRRVYNVAIRDLKRTESESKTPIFTRVTETVSGLGTIRAFGKERMLMESFEELTDWYHSVFYTFNSAIRWLSIRLDALAVSVTGVTAILILIFHGSVSAAASGLALSYAAQLSGIFQFTVRLASETESKFVAVERMRNFLKFSHPEEMIDCDDKGERKGSNSLMVHSCPDIHPNWPFSGHVKFNSVYLSYSSDSPPVLRDICFDIQAGQKIGIIGRTGSGKSSIGSALFRLLELKSGQILIDDVDISQVPLGKLRNALCVIPQEPAIFQRNIRFNLDPGNVHTDEELWEVLVKTGLKSAVESLDSEIGFSQGQKQLLSITRAFLRQSKVIFVDEATSNVDIETAAMMDRILVEEFRESTVFIVAHRLSALTFCDHLIIMEDGEIRDFGPADIITRKPEFMSHFERFDSVPLL